jgi:hypothetical protein
MRSICSLDSNGWGISRRKSFNSPVTVFKSGSDSMATSSPVLMCGQSLPHDVEKTHRTFIDCAFELFDTLL